MHVLRFTRLHGQLSISYIDIHLATSHPTLLVNKTLLRNSRTVVRMFSYIREYNSQHHGVNIIGRVKEKILLAILLILHHLMLKIISIRSKMLGLT